MSEEISVIKIWEAYQKESQAKHKISRNALDLIIWLLREDLIEESAIKETATFARENNGLWTQSSQAVSELELYRIIDGLNLSSEVQALTEENKKLKDLFDIIRNVSATAFDNGIWFSNEQFKPIADAIAEASAQQVLKVKH